ncbi:MAG: hypothetical protein HYU69_15495 [Bacteroidetes bacterium]|nr:hypothetical protein [Bacteroidota bacterium]
MSKIPSRDVFDLIHSLSKAEKAYFKTYYFSEKEKEHVVYIKLFDAIEQQEEYNEEQLKRELRIGLVKMRNSKFYLYNAILRSLEVQNYSSKSNYTLLHYLSQAEILQEKRLFKQSKSLIDKGKKMALKYDKPWFEAEFSRIENRVDSPKTTEDIGGLFNKIFLSINKYKNNIELSKLYEIIKHYSRIESSSLSRKQKDQIKNIFNHPLLKNEKSCLTFSALNSYYKSHASISQVIRDHKKAELMIERCIQLFEKNPHQINDNFETYFISIENMIISKLNMKDFDGAFVYINKTRTLKPKIKQLSFHRYFRAIGIELLYYLQISNFDTAYKIIKQEDSTVSNIVLDESTSKLREEVVVGLYTISCICFIVGDYKRAKKCLNLILNQTDNIRPDIFSFSKILFALIQLEEDNLTPSMIISTYKYLKSRNKLNKLEGAVLRFLKRISSKTFDKKELIKLYKQLFQEIVELTKDPMEAKTLEYFDFISWVESKIENRSFAEMIREKAKLSD